MEGKELEKADVREYDDSLSDFNLKFNGLLKTTKELKDQFVGHHVILEQISRHEADLKKVGDEKEFNRLLTAITDMKNFYEEKK